MQWEIRKGGRVGKLGQDRESRKKISICTLQIRKLKLRKAVCPTQPGSQRLCSDSPQGSSLRVRNPARKALEGRITVRQDKVIGTSLRWKMCTVNTQGGGLEGRRGEGGGGLWVRQSSLAARSAPANMPVASAHGTRFQLVEDEKQTQRKFFERERLGTRGDRKRHRKF